MRITNIEYDNGVYSITFNPCFIERVFGMKEKIKKYKKRGDVFLLSGRDVIINQNGEKLRSDNVVTIAINNWDNSF